MVEGENNVLGVGIQIHKGLDNVRGATDVLKENPKIGAAEGWEGIAHVEEASGRRWRGGHQYR
jgi:hypothetical protein